MKYQPLIDLKLIPIELFPEKKFLPKSMPFIIYEISSFVKTLRNMIDYMKEYEKTKIICRKYPNSPSNSISQISTIKRTRIISEYLTSNLDRTLSSPDFIQTPLFPVNVDIRKYVVTDPERINNNSIPFNFCILNQDEQICQPQNQCKNFEKNLFLENNQFNENDLVLFKQHLSSSFPLELKNCIHQLAIEQKLETIEVCDILIKLNHNELDDKDIPKIIRNLQSTASNNKTKNSVSNISNLMKILLRIDQLEKYNKLNKQEVKIFNERINHL